MIAALPAPNVSGFSNNYASFPRATLTDDKGDGRLDYILKHEDRDLRTLQRSQGRHRRCHSIPGDAGDGGNGTIHAYNRQIAAGITHSFSPEFNARCARRLHVDAWRQNAVSRGKTEHQCRRGYSRPAHRQGRDSPPEQRECQELQHVWSADLKPAVPESVRHQSEDQLLVDQEPPQHEVWLGVSRHQYRGRRLQSGLWRRDLQPGI